MKIYIYVLIDPFTKEVRYVGKTMNPKQRHRKHLMRKENTHKYSWVKSLQSRGSRPEMQVIEEMTVAADSEWQPVEQWWIQRLRAAGCPLTNLNDGGIGGIRPSEETLKKLSDSHKGKTHSPETRAKQSASKKGIPKSEETRKKFSQRMLGWTPSQETRRKMSENSKRLMTPEHIELLKRTSSTPEARAKMSASLKGKKQSEETIRKRFAWREGKKIVMSEEQKAKLSEKAKLRMTPERVLYLTLCRTNPEAAKAMRSECGFSGLPVVHR